MITKFEIFNENKSLENHDDILFVVDVQSEFEEFIPKNFVKKLNKYCKEFENVYQIWDSNKSKKPTYKFPNQIEAIEKQFGVKKYYKKLDGGMREWFYNIFGEQDGENIFKKFKSKKIKEGDKFKLKDKNEYLVYIDNDHNWFYVNNKFLNILKKLKGKSIIITGGAGGECIKDIDVSAKSFGLYPIYNHEYVYDATYSELLK